MERAEVTDPRRNTGRLVLLPAPEAPKSAVLTAEEDARMVSGDCVDRSVRPTVKPEWAARLAEFNKEGIGVY